MTWGETSSPVEADVHPLTPPLQRGPSEAELERAEAKLPDLAAEMSSWAEAPVALADDAGLSAMGEHAQALGYLWVELPAPGPEFRGRLGLYIEEGLELCLEQLGAPPAGIHASSSLDASLSDQLYRARFVERRGLALGIPNLEGIANLGRTLDADDSSVLRWWIAATADRPVRLVVSTKNQFLRVYPSPVLFDSLFELCQEPVSPRAPSVALAESAQAMELSDLPPAVIEEPLAPAAEPEPAPPEPAIDVAPPPEPTTNVLGTRVAPVFDVALPGLDRALGLLADGLADPELGDPLEQEEPDRAELLEHDRREAITLAPPAEEPALGLMDDSPAEAGLAPASSLEEMSTTEETAAPAPIAPIAPIAPVGLEQRESAPVASPLEPPRIDADEFLRVLEEDSRPPPAAAAADSAPLPADLVPVEREPEPTPLPQKKLRRPFLRMAEETPADDAQGDQAPADALPADAVLARDERTDDAQAEPGELETTGGEPAGAPVARSEATPTAKLPLDASDPFNQLAAKEWRSWRDALAQAAGPRPLAAIERMFVTDYTRLAEAARRGIADETARAALGEWQTSFQKSYAETFDALRVRGKRPTMVLDLPDIAQRLGRLQGARRVQLLMIDGLRFDLGLMVQERLRARVDAALTERLLLWSALPSTTTYQLELLGKGPEGLLERWDGEESPTLVARGRAARTARRIRTGRLEVQKIDVVEDALRTLGRPVAERMDEIAGDAAEAIAEHMAAQPPRTLIVVFGDHGFLLDAARAGTTEEVRQGGSSPEEVLVPAFAWLTGAVH